MPEMPEVETVRRGLEPTLVGARILRVELRRPDLRFPFPPDFAKRLEGRRVENLSRRAKYLIAALDDGAAVIAHLGMSGSFRVESSESAVVTSRRIRSGAIKKRGPRSCRPPFRESSGHL